MWHTANYYTIFQFLTHCPESFANDQPQINNDNWKKAFDQIIDLNKNIWMTHAIQDESVVSKIVITTSKGITEMEVSKLIVSQINMASPKLPVMVLGIGLDANMIGLENFASEPNDFIQTIGKNHALKN